MDITENGILQKYYNRIRTAKVNYTLVYNIPTYTYILGETGATCHTA